MTPKCSHSSMRLLLRGVEKPAYSAGSGLSQIADRATQAGVYKKGPMFVAVGALVLGMVTPTPHLVHCEGGDAPFASLCTGCNVSAFGGLELDVWCDMCHAHLRDRSYIRCSKCTTQRCKVDTGCAQCEGCCFWPLNHIVSTTPEYGGGESGEGGGLSVE